ncbi:mitochondrial carrier [Pholiota conissans]|uniref:Mitochondrial carrier n=1 Tax=Pholiota conissans TaxID=109636 RepID=A0A9P5ZDS6_9AGAR|nr:mitochondrial carrier [Pholiota conissans]
MPESHAPKSAIDNPQGRHSDDLLEPSIQPFIPHLRSDPISHPHTLEEFREAEGRENRKRKLLEIWKSLPETLQSTTTQSSKTSRSSSINSAEAESLKATYDNELLLHCAGPSSGSRTRQIEWKEFKKYAEAKEIELWHIFHNELDLDGNGQIDAQELQNALNKSGIKPPPSTIKDFMTSVSSGQHSPHITFDEFRNFFILLPRKVSPVEIYQYYEMRKYMGDDGRGAARVNMEGDVSLSAEDKPPSPLSYDFASYPLPSSVASKPMEGDVDEEYGYPEDYQEVDEPQYQFLEGHTAVKFLFAGGIAGAVSRTCTAPFDRLKIFLITRPPELGGPSLTGQTKHTGIRIIGNALTRIYSEGGLLAFWTGNGLSVAKIFPESAIKFFAYESAKRAFAKYYDKVDDPRDISGFSRFLSGGIGGISSQLSIYPIETLKTQMMSNTGQQKRHLIDAMRHVWALGGVRRYYRGLTIGLVGVFPYSAIDMSTFEALKQAYQRSTGTQEPGVLALLAFGSISGSVGATSVYPLNLVRTRLQASGSSGHPQTYTGPWDVARKTWAADGWRGFYRGLFPTLAKVVPAVSISYVVYEHTKRRLGV